MRDLTPQQIVEELDRWIIGQEDAKRAVAVAIRNRWRRQQLPAEAAREVSPKNIIMIGPTGVGKTEIARRIAQLTGAPFVKVEATKFTEVGYHGRDVDGMVRDLLENAIALVHQEHAREVEARAQAQAEEELLDLLAPAPPSLAPVDPTEPETAGHAAERLRERLREKLRAGALDEREVELVTRHKPQVGAMFANMGMENLDPDMAGMFDRLMPEQSRRRRTTVREARRALTEQGVERLLDRDKVIAQAIERAEQTGIVFIDEIDKIASPSSEGGQGPEVSRQGVQRDLLPIVEGSAVTTRHGTVHTDHVLFIAAGAFHDSDVSDLMPELQGRFPIRVALSSLRREDFVRILTEPHNSVARQQAALLEVEGLRVVYEEGSLETLAEMAAEANDTFEDIGARRLMTIVEKVFQQASFDAPQMVARGETEFRVTRAFVRKQITPYLKDKDLGRHAL